RIIAVSQFVADSVIASGIEPQHVAVVYDGVEIPAETTIEEHRAARARWEVKDQELLLGCVGYLLPEKNQETLLRAMTEIHRQLPNCRVILAGDGPCRVKLQALAEELRIEDEVIFAGFVEDVGAVYRALDLFVFPSLAEPLGSSLLAAMAHGLPVIAVASGGVPEIIKNGRDGILVDSSDAGKLAASICQMLRQLNDAARMGKAAREAVMRHFSAQLLAENTLRQYQMILSMR
ncbi:MAG: glycosyltransferase family 4 protein, partial [Candidatus Acidiferrales bacterium]